MAPAVNLKARVAAIDQHFDAQLENCITMQQAEMVERMRDEAHAEIMREFTAQARG